MGLKFNMLLGDAGIAPADVRLLRHQTTKHAGKTPYSVWRDRPDDFEVYQSTQDPAQRARFNGAYWASFVAPPGGDTLFVGLYKVCLVGSVPDGTIDPLTGGPVGGVGCVAPYDQYVCTPAAALAAYRGRLSITWGASSSASRAWVQRADKQDKEIVALTKEFQEEEFPGFTKLTRPLSELDTMPSAWQQILKNSRGVYLLACPRSREHYIGSASGTAGFLGRWQEYFADGHGGNVALRSRDPSDYLVSILEVAGSSASVADIVDMEENWKLKLHSRDIGLNRN